MNIKFNRTYTRDCDTKSDTNTKNHSVVQKLQSASFSSFSNFFIFSGTGTPECAGLGRRFHIFLLLFVTLPGNVAILFSLGFGVATFGTVLVLCLDCAVVSFTAMQDVKKMFIRMHEMTTILYFLILV